MTVKSDGPGAAPSVHAAGSSDLLPAPALSSGELRYFGVTEALLLALLPLTAVAATYAYESAFLSALGVPGVLMQIDGGTVIRLMAPTFLGTMGLLLLILPALSRSMWRLLFSVFVLSLAFVVLTGLWGYMVHGQRIADVVVPITMLALIGVVYLVRRAWGARSVRSRQTVQTGARARAAAFADAAQRVAATRWYGRAVTWALRTVDLHADGVAIDLSEQLGRAGLALGIGGVRLGGAAVVAAAAMMLAREAGTVQAHWSAERLVHAGVDTVVLLRRYGDRALVAPTTLVLSPGATALHATCFRAQFSIVPLEAVSPLRKIEPQVLAPCKHP